jgi:YgiT-type zinc finger domain-containing protein
MLCEFCNIPTVSKKVKRLHWYKKQLYIVENVPAEVCPECGERYFHAQVLDEIDRMLEAGYEVIERIQVDVMSL